MIMTAMTDPAANRINPGRLIEFATDDAFAVPNLRAKLEHVTLQKAAIKLTVTEDRLKHGAEKALAYEPN